MAKNKLQTVLADLDRALDEREAMLDDREKSLIAREEAVRATENGFLERQIELDKREAQIVEHEAIVEQKLSKIRSDEALTMALQKQAEELKQIEMLSKKVTEERALSEYNLGEVAKREKAVSEREENYKQEVELKIAKQFLNSKGS